jgi:regulator of RNase E activity RraA
LGIGTLWVTDGVVTDGVATLCAKDGLAKPVIDAAIRSAKAVQAARFGIGSAIRGF